MKVNKVKVGFVGLGENGLSHIQAHLRCGKSEVVALCELNQDRLNKIGEELGIKKLYRDEEIFEDSEVEAISIHTGDNEHRKPFIEALKHGKHIFIEKPLANTEEDVIAMVEAARRSGKNIKIQVGYILRFNPVFCKIGELTNEGKLGTIYYMEADYVHNLIYQKEQWDSHTNSNWYLEHEKPMVGGGSHAIDLLRWLSCKEVVSVFGYSNHYAFPEMKNDDCQVALYKFSDGTIAKVASLYAPRMDMAPYYNLRLYGTQGTAERDQVAISSKPDDLHPAFNPVNANKIKGHPYDEEIIDWIDSIRNDGRNTRIGVYDGANSTIATLYACRSMKEKREVDVPIFSY